MSRKTWSGDCLSLLQASGCSHAHLFLSGLSLSVTLKKTFLINCNIWYFCDWSWQWRWSSPISFRLIKERKAIVAVRKNTLAFPSMRCCRLLWSRHVFQVGETSCPRKCLGWQQGEVTSFDLFTAAKCKFFPFVLTLSYSLMCLLVTECVYNCLFRREKPYSGLLFCFFFP